MRTDCARRHQQHTVGVQQDVRSGEPIQQHLPDGLRHFGSLDAPYLSRKRRCLRTARQRVQRDYQRATRRLVNACRSRFYATTTLEQAARTFIARRDRTAHPTGKFDKGGRWYPSEAETCDCCSSVRSPSRAHPFSYMVHCRTMKHVANLYGVSVADLRKEVARLDPDSAPAKPSREGGDRYYKAVKRTSDGRLVSIHDGRTEYRLGEEMQEAARQNHGGGFYAYRTIEEAIKFARFAECADFEILQGRHQQKDRQLMMTLLQTSAYL